MKKAFYLFWFIVFSCSSPRPELREGDILFQISRSSQSRALQLATRSPYNHMGILYVIHGKYYVYEAVQPVTLTPLEIWIRRGLNHFCMVKRLKDASALLTPEILKKMRAEGEKFKGRDYDMYFEWSDERIYCSELVWKIYKRGAGAEIGKLKKIRDFDLSSPVVQKKMEERYGKRIPWDEWAVSPADMLHSERLFTVSENYVP